MTLLKEEASSKIWMIIASFYPQIGGAEQQVQRLSERLIAHSWRASVLTRRHNPQSPYLPPAQETINGVPVHRVYSQGNSKLASLLFVFSGLWHLWSRDRNRIYHAHDIGAPAWLAVAARYLLGGRCLIKLRTGCYLYEPRLSSRVARWQFLTLLRLADRIVVVNREVERLLHRLGIPPTRVVRIPNAVNTKQFYPILAQGKIEVRQRLDLPNNKTIVLYVGRLEQIKGVDILLQAWALLPEWIRNNALLVIVGDGAECENLLHLIASAKIQESVFLAGLQKSIRDYYWAADIFVLPSRTEGLSNALVEAMACGLPVIASNVGGTPDVVEEGRNGSLFESEDYSQLIQKLTTMMEMPEQWVEMGMSARRAVMAYADMDTIADRLRDLYRQLI